MNRFILWSGILIFSLTAQGQSASAPAAPTSSLSFKPDIVFDKIMLETGGFLREPSASGFVQPSWKLGIKTAFATWIEVNAVLGPSTLISTPSWVTGTSSQAVSLIEGYGLIRAVFGDVSAGLIPIPWGLQSEIEEELWFPRTFIYERGLRPLRDVGVGVTSEYDGFYLTLVGHNGEGGLVSNSDNRAFVTGQWGYKGPANSHLGLSATTGKINQPWLTEETRQRAGNAFFGFNIFGLGLQIETSYFQTVTASQTTDSLAWHVDLGHPIGEQFTILGRYEQYNPNAKISANVLGRGYFGLEFHSRDVASRLFLFVIKNNEAQGESPNDEIRVVWRIIPPKS
ncbi:MAG: hypothetical protein IT289_13595 [Oligoflexia bacterium]|nr:hypothetical protein [Oligoflexia bacterium]